MVGALMSLLYIIIIIIIGGEGISTEGRKEATMVLEV